MSLFLVSMDGLVTAQDLLLLFVLGGLAWLGVLLGVCVVQIGRAATPARRIVRSTCSRWSSSGSSPSSPARTKRPSRWMPRSRSHCSRSSPG